ncbi:hypothetical protein N180_17445 [Pedobacter antarcticus 4BY]|uniref:Uncharacterized protein n=2 Tax=Pedobacter antarcticus TaxID=34086 RepID=A0A081PLC9_9SPHI|nr:PspC domain-containing protein [Pedobacter antarcticus]KEQ31502.1 hypothetical protein N180_17445 [Pedobacter antarcticus 4BY]SFF31297.1 phage shock protein C (PspC) family protein [Pedobacter antarcticus]
MKKTLNINIGNSIIHIEEDAYEILTQYLIAVKQHFGKSADDFEIVKDIENRIAEMFADILQAQHKQVIQKEDVEVVTGLMGSVSDFGDAEEEEQPVFTADKEERPVFGERRIYRDTEDAMISGVCSGLSYYLKIDVSILRVIAVITALMGGSGILAYLILWITIPKAHSRSERMAMKGEAVNLKGFKRNFDQEMAQLKDNLQHANAHIQPMVKRSGTFITEFIEVMDIFLKGTGKKLLQIIAILIMIFSSIAFLATIGALAASMGFWNTGLNSFFPFTLVDAAEINNLLLAVFVVIAIPLLALILFAVRVAFNTVSIPKALSFGMLIIWLAGLSFTIFYVARTTTEFKDTAAFTRNYELKSYPEFTLKMDTRMFFSKEDSLRYHLDTTEKAGAVVRSLEESPFTLPKNVSLTIERSESGKPELIRNYSSKGRSFEQALNLAKQIRYDFTQQDSLLQFSPELQLMQKANWRDQQVELILRLPEGTRVKIDPEMDRYLRNYSLWECRDDEDHSGTEYYYKGIITAEGLRCQN